MKKSLTIVIPCYNEEKNIINTYIETKNILKSLSQTYTYNFIFVDDGSSDKTVEKINDLLKNNKDISLIIFSRNFGKELATTAGINNSTSDATIIMDADGQHPPILIKKFLSEWENGSNVIIGVRDSNKGEGFIKKYGSKTFYKMFNKFSGASLVPGSTDFRLIDRNVRETFNQLSENDRITRALIDWVGFRKSYIKFDARERFAGKASYSNKKLFALALNSFISMSFAPLYAITYLGIFTVLASFILGVFSIVEEYILNDPLGINITGSAFIGILILFLVGIILITQGIASLYIAKIYKESKRRPLYIIDKGRSIFN